MPIWIVRVGDRLYIRSYRGAGARWFRRVSQGHAARIGGRDVELVASHEEDDAIDDAYRAKYGHSVYADAMVAEEARATTLLVSPRSG